MTDWTKGVGTTPELPFIDNRIEVLQRTFRVISQCDHCAAMRLVLVGSRLSQVVAAWHPVTVCKRYTAKHLRHMRSNEWFVVVKNGWVMRTCASE